jgi:transaldolase/fructose-6-phosphate aldolase-like protein
MTVEATHASTIQQLAGFGQSLWLDNLQRKMIRSGELARLRDAGVTGITSNPTIFEKAISGSADYEQDLVRLLEAGQTPDQVMWQLMIDDVQAAADIFRLSMTPETVPMGSCRSRSGRRSRATRSAQSKWRRSVGYRLSGIHPGASLAGNDSIDASVTLSSLDPSARRVCSVSGR